METYSVLLRWLAFAEFISIRSKIPITASSLSLWIHLIHAYPDMPMNDEHSEMQIHAHVQCRLQAPSNDDDGLIDFPLQALHML